MSTATLDGSFVFGIAVSITETPQPNVQQMAEFFGVDGMFTLYGGRRGRVFQVEGVLVGFTIGFLNEAEAQLLSMADGRAHTLFDTRQRTWENVIFPGAFSPDPRGPRPATWSDGEGGTNTGWALPYKALLIGLT